MQFDSRNTLLQSANSRASDHIQTDRYQTQQSHTTDGNRYLCCINVFLCITTSGKYEALQTAMLTAEQFHDNNVGLILSEKQITN